MTRKCLFCDHTANSREHIFPDWVNTIFPPVPGGGAEVVQYSANGTIVNKWPSNKVAGHRAKVVCKCCNGAIKPGWMSELEGEIKHLLKGMIEGKPGGLTPVQQLLLARWAAKTAMVGESIMKFPRVFTDDDGHLIRTQGRPPLRASVKLAAFEGRDIPTRYMRSVGSAEIHGAPVMDLYFHTIQVGCVVLQVRGTVSLPPTENISLQRVAQPGFFEIPIFPPVEQCSWPPRMKLNEQLLGQYSAGGKEPPIPAAGTYPA